MRRTVGTKTGEQTLNLQLRCGTREMREIKKVKWDSDVTGVMGREGRGQGWELDQDNGTPAVDGLTNSSTDRNNCCR